MMLCAAPEYHDSEILMVGRNSLMVSVPDCEPSGLGFKFPPQ